MENKNYYVLAANGNCVMIENHVNKSHTNVVKTAFSIVSKIIITLQYVRNSNFIYVV
ncbi:hypothetical protein [Liquorilactobacillus oeni]|uniref:hypothetical protein n=1 Tax=Liquorilactobacillus oeni TaxID=303241 RepID=UPI001F451A1D|nr:hypothetical protein [Liquorilactobacillus oeni]